MDKIINKLSKKLQITTEELRNMLIVAVNSDNSEMNLIEIIGYENFDDAIYILKNKNELFGSKYTEKEYLEYYIPPKECIKEKGLKVEKYLNKIFPYEYFNQIQSKVKKFALDSDENLLICAPTGSGKTDIAIMAILRSLNNGSVVYVVPMRALATEITWKLKNKFKEYKINRKVGKKYIKKDVVVGEYTGDTELSKSEIKNIDIIVCTPEKFDVATRRLYNVFEDSVSMVIFDEIHMLQDDRGPVIESLVTRLLKISEIRQKYIRLIGLSATLPNYNDIGRFIHAKHIFKFDEEYRSVPLAITLIGADLNQYTKIVKQKISKNSTLIFVGSRNETVKFARILIKECDQLSEENIRKIDKHLKEMKNITHFNSLKNLLQHGIGIHHGGLPRNVRLCMENLFRLKIINILVCTTTLAWGVNLPANTVIIKGTTYYNQDKGEFTNMSILDILQIFGRAGRPDFETQGNAILITSREQFKIYLKLLKNQDPIESKMLHHLCDLLNAEINTTIQTFSESLNWLRNTFLYIRMKKNPRLYGIQLNENINVFEEYLMMACRRLEECNLIHIESKYISDQKYLESDNYEDNKLNLNYENNSGKNNENLEFIKNNKIITDYRLIPTYYGKISSFYYLNHMTINQWLSTNPKDEYSIIILILNSYEFQNIILRDEEINNLSLLCENLQIENYFNDESKINLNVYKSYILLLAYINKIQIQSFSLLCDTHFIIKNIKRILNAYERFNIYQKNYEIFYVTYQLRKKIEMDYKIINQLFKLSNIDKYNLKSNNQVNNQINLKSNNQVNNQINLKSNNQVNNQINLKSNNQVNDQINLKSNNQVNDQINLKSNNQVNDQINLKSNNQVNDQIICYKLINDYVYLKVPYNNFKDNYIILFKNNNIFYASKYKKLGLNQKNLLFYFMVIFII